MSCIVVNYILSTHSKLTDSADVCVHIDFMCYAYWSKSCFMFVSFTSIPRRQVAYVLDVVSYFLSLVFAWVSLFNAAVVISCVRCVSVASILLRSISNFKSFILCILCDFKVNATENYFKIIDSTEILENPQFYQFQPKWFYSFCRYPEKFSECTKIYQVKPDRKVRIRWVKVKICEF